MAVAIHPAGQHDSTTIDELLDGLCLQEIPSSSRIFMDKGYDSEHIREGFSFLDITVIIPRRHPRKGRPWNLGKWRWMIERSISWFNCFGKVRRRQEKKEVNYIAILQLCAACITLNTVLG